MSDQQNGVFDKETLIAHIQAHIAGQKPDVSVAMLIAANAFCGDKDRNGQPYVLHLARALKSGTQSNAKIIVGLLHDLIEDKDWTFADLRRVGFDDVLVSAVQFVTRRKGENGAPDEPYFDMIERCGMSVLLLGEKDKYLALDVKLEDLSHNMSNDRQTAFLTLNQIAKQNVYIVARNYLVAIKKGEIEPGTPMRDFMEKRPKLRDMELLMNNSSCRPVGRIRLEARRCMEELGLRPA